MYKNVQKTEHSFKLTDEVTLPIISDTESLIPDAMDCANPDQRQFCTEITCNIEYIQRGAVYSNGFKLTLTGRVGWAGDGVTLILVYCGLFDGVQILVFFFGLRKQIKHCCCPILPRSAPDIKNPPLPGV